MNDDEKKAKVLHTRVPESLERELKQKAHSLGLSVSTLVRNVLANAFGLVEDIVADGAAIAQAARGEGESPADELADQGVFAPGSTEAGRVIGWQTSLLNLNAVCGRCNGLLPRGTEAAIAVLQGPGRKPIVCSACVLAFVEDRSEDAGDA